MVAKNNNCVVVDQAMYQVAFVLSTLQELKKKGLIEGGFNIKKKKEMTEILRIGEQKDFKEPNEKETIQIMNSIQRDLNRR